VTNGTEREAKRCPRCGEWKLLDDFGFNKRMPDGRAQYCRLCFGSIAKASYRKRQSEQGKQVRERRDLPEGFKYCPRCEEIKLVEQFGRNRSARSGLTAYCLPCHNEVGADNRIKNHGTTRNFQLKRRYGVTETEVEAIRKRQGRICVICLRSPSAHVDHDHETGQMRGVLCFSCNGALGQFQDDPWRLRQAADYLERRLRHHELVVQELEETGFVMPTPILERRGGRRGDELRARFPVGDAYLARMVELQVKLCPICLDERPEHVDHDHKTGEVRGVLCPGCNSGMGQLRDDPNSLRRAADYLEGLLIREVPTADGGTRLSFTLPDVDPATVRINGWRRHREADAANRRLLAELSEELSDLPGVYVKYRHPALA
jgi:Recombination endonuclease VII